MGLSLNHRLSAPVHAEQVALLYKNAPLAYLITFINGLILVYIQRNAVSAARLILWFTLLALATVGRALLAYSYARRRPPPTAALGWGRRYLFGAALAGLAWGSAAILLFPPDNITYQVTVAFVLAGMTAAAVGALAIDRLVAWAFVLPALAPLLLQFLWQGAEIQTAMGVMTLLFLIGLMFIIQHVNDSILHALRLNIEKAALFDQLQRDKEYAEQLNARLQQEIIEHRETETKLRESQETYRLTMDAALVGIYVIQKQTFHYVNPLMARLFGYAPQEMEGTLSPLDVVAPEQQKLVRRYRPSQNTGMPNRPLEIQCVRKDGSRFEALAWTRAVAHGDQRIIVGTVVDITARKQMEVALRQANATLEDRVKERTARLEEANVALRESEAHARSRAEELAALLDAAPAVIFIARDPACATITGNRAAHQLLRAPLEANLSRTGPTGDSLRHFKVFQNGVELSPSELPVQRAARGVEMRDFEEEVIFSDGARFHIYGNAVPLRDSRGQVRGAIAAFVDITRRRAAEAALRDSETRYRQLFELCPDAIFINRSNQVVAINAAGLHLFGAATPMQLLGKSPFELFHPDYHTLIQERISAIWTEQGQEAPLMEERIVRLDGAIRDVEVAAVSYMDNGKIALQVVLRDITQRKAAEQALQDAAQRKDEFLAMLAHELRNPLAPIRNAVQILRRLGPAGAQLQWARDVIDRQVGHLARLVDDLLDVSRLLRGKITLRKESLDLATVIQHAVESSRPLIEARRHTLTVSLPPQPLQLEGDLTRLAQVFSNLLNNAAKYTEEGGRIELVVEADDKEARIRVRDTGVGIPTTLLPQVFDLFTQAERTLDRTQGGLGIGLTIVKNLVELHGGSVEAYSEGPGRGSEFRVRLPLSGALPNSQMAPVAASAPATAQKLRILVVDDNVDVAESVAVLLGLEGHQTRTAYTGAAALALAAAFQPQVVLLDLGLPGMDGYEVARRLRAEPATAKARIIALTGYGQPADRERTRLNGFDQHLVKPVEPELLYQAVTESGQPTSDRGGSVPAEPSTRQTT